ncbi:MAG: (2Fe-2S)-binding protein, partial [Turicibacter sp.]|nr:(2Fe-2S)-binding protein [Turicibacter sp.]
MGVVHITINGMPYEVLDTYTILEAAREVGIKIPTLCFLKGLNETGACRVCVVEVKGARSLVTACNMKVQEGMEILTHSKKVLDTYTILEAAREVGIKIPTLCFLKG